MPEARSQWGLYYYYNTMAKSLDALDIDYVTDNKGVKHDWRVELLQQLAKEQQSDGHWIGTQRWMENRPVLSTTFGVLALQEAVADLKEHPPK